MADVPARDRPRERLLRLGPEALSEQELVALVLGSGRRGESVLALAAELIAEFGGAAGLARARPEELTRRPGVGPARAAALVAALRLGRLASVNGDESPVLRRAEDVAAIALRELHGLRRERVLVLVCDAGNRLRRVVTVTDGELDRTAFPVRAILNAVLRHDGRAFAVAHNHPSGDPTPSPADVKATDELRRAVGPVRLRLLDHVVVGGTDWRSAMRDERMPGSAATVREPAREPAGGS